MILTFEEYKISNNVVEEVIQSSNMTNLDIKDKILMESKIIKPEHRTEFLDHMSTIFLNIILNKESEVGKEGINKAIESRKIISNIKFN